MRHWLLTRMLYWPARVPASFSSWLPGGTRRSLMLAAALMRTSLLYASLLSSGLSFLMSCGARPPRCPYPGTSGSLTNSNGNALLTSNVIICPGPKLCTNQS